MKMKTHIQQLEDKVQFLEDELKRKNRLINGLKDNNRKLTNERDNFQHQLENIKSMSLWKFAAQYCNDESLEQAGHQLAKDLLR